MTTKRKVKFRPQLISALVLVGALALSVLPTPRALAAGDAYFSLSPSSGSYKVGNSFTVTVYETSTAADNTNSVIANLTYNSSLLQWTGTSLGAFSLPLNNSGGGGSVNVTAAYPNPGNGQPNYLTGTQSVAFVSFKVLSSGTASVNLGSGSDIDNTGGASVWDGASKSASFSLSAASTSSGTTSPKPSSTSTNTKSPAPSPSPTPAPTPTPAVIAQPGGASNQVDNAAVTIIVTDTNGQPIKNAKVTLDGKTAMYTDAQGKASFSVESAGSHAVTVTAPGKKPYQTRVTLAANESVPLELQLASASSNGLIFGIVGVVGLVLIAGGVLYFFRGQLPWGSGTGQFIPPSAASHPPVVGFNNNQSTPPAAPQPPASAHPAAPAASIPQHRAMTSGFDSLDGMRRKF